MKPNDQQEQWLQEYLYQVMAYRETYEEVYDHVLTALADKAEEEFFESTINKIITNDFDGLNGLVAMEEECKATMDKDFSKLYQCYFIGFLKFPAIIYTALIGLAIYQIFSHISLITFAIIIIAPLIPYLLLAIRGFQYGYTFGSRKSSLRDSILRKIAYKPILYGLIFNLLSSITALIVRNVFHYHANHFVSNKHINPVYLTIIGVLVAIHLLTFLKLLKNEFKISIAN